MKKIMEKFKNKNNSGKTKKELEKIKKNLEFF